MLHYKLAKWSFAMHRKLFNFLTYSTNIKKRRTKHCKNTKIFQIAQNLPTGKQTEAQTFPAFTRSRKPSGGNHEC
jgi:hypothetical protein